jgi:hypothetical protein
MIIPIKGIYKEGHVILKEEAPVNKETEVVVTFFIDEKEAPKKGKRMPGGLKGQITITDDFNEPLDDLKDYM